MWFPPAAAGVLWVGLWFSLNDFAQLGLALQVLFWLATFGLAWRKRSWFAPLFFLGLVLLAQISQNPVFANLTKTVDAVGASQRVAIANAVDGLSVGSKALVLGLTDGDTSLLPSVLNDQLKLLSLTHLNAVSGTNCSIVVALLLLVAKGFALPRSARGLLAAGVLVAYLVLVGNQPSVLRAAVMAVVMIVGLNSGMRFRALHLLAFGVICLLLLQPQLAQSLGLALSAAATLGVLEFAPRLGEWFRRWLPEWLALPASVALTAQLFCLPLLVAVQSEFSVFGLLANLLAEPVVPFITVLGVSGALLTLLIPPLAPPLFWAASIGAQYLVFICDWLSGYSGAFDWPGGAQGLLLALLLLTGAVALVQRSRPTKLVGVAVMVVLIMFLVPRALAGLPTGSFPVGNWFYLACDVGQGDATILRSRGEVAVIDVGREPLKINRCLKRLGITHISILVLTHFDLDHVGGLAGAVAGRRVDRALVTDFRDPRPGAFLANLALHRFGITVQKVHLGKTGTLGKFHWLVLSPHPDGAGSSDSNDGSVSMYFTNGSVGIFTMADLPATGQRRLISERGRWWNKSLAALPTILKVSHHGSADQEPAFIRWVHPLISTISVGAGNSYGHPTQRALGLLRRYSRVTLRTDLLGGISIRQNASGSLTWAPEKRG